jgi:hypothetical protein
MRTNVKMWALASGGVIAVAGLLAVAQPEGAAKKPEAPAGAQAGGQPGAEDMMKMWAQMNAPGEHHKHLDKFVGEWDAKTKVWMDPAAPAMESAGRMSQRMEFGGRFLYSTYKGEFMGQAFNGVALTGYNNATKKHEGFWVDSMSTGMTMSTGSCDSEGKVFTFLGERDDPMTGGKVKTREVMTFKDADTYVQEFFETHDGAEARTMEITYTRAKDAMKPAKAPADAIRAVRPAAPAAPAEGQPLPTPPARAPKAPN